LQANWQSLVTMKVMFFAMPDCQGSLLFLIFDIFYVEFSTLVSLHLGSSTSSSTCYSTRASTLIITASFTRLNTIATAIYSAFSFAIVIATILVFLYCIILWLNAVLYFTFCRAHAIIHACSYTSFDTTTFAASVTTIVTIRNANSTITKQWNVCDRD